MKLRYIVPCLWLLASEASAQMPADQMELLLLNKKDSIGIPDYKVAVTMSGAYSINSNSVTNEFVGTLGYRQEFVDEDLKDQESKRLKKNNRIGADAWVGLQGLYKGKKLNWVFGIGHREFFSGKFPKDVFELVFRGNASYAGEEANLSKTHIRYFNYQSFYVGIQKEIKDYTFGAALSILRGGRYVDVNFREGSLYTAPMGQYIDIGRDFDVSYSRMSDPYFKSHGLGAALNLSASVKRGRNVISLELRDLGFIAWSGLKNYSGDGTYRYNGLLLNDVLASGSSFASGIKLDSIAAQMGVAMDSAKSVMMFLPAQAHLSYQINPNKRFSRTVGIKYMLTPGYIPRVYIRGADYLGKGFTLVNTFSYGGFGRLDFEIGMLKKFKNSFIVSANLFAFEYLVLPGKSSGNGVNIGLTKLF